MERLPNEILYKIADFIDDDEDINSFFIALSNYTYRLRSRIVEFHNNQIVCMFCGEYSRSICSNCIQLNIRKYSRFYNTRQFDLANYKLHTNLWTYTANGRNVYDKNEWVDLEVAYKNLKKLNKKQKHCCLKTLMKVSRLPRYWIMINNTCQIKKIYMRRWFWFKFNIADVIKKIKQNL
jgi:hypothetical protein